MRDINSSHHNTDQEKQELLEEVAQVEKLAASIRRRMRALSEKRGGEDATVTSITARMRRLELPGDET